MGVYNSESPEALAAAIQNLCRYEVLKFRSEIVFGRVTVVEEGGAITITTFDGIEIGNARLVLSMFCKERTIHIPYDGSEGDDEDKDSHVHGEDESLGKVTFVLSPGSGGATLMIKSTDVPVTNGDTGTGGIVDFKHKHKIHPALPTIKLWRGLVEGDIVVMSNMGNGMYYVHERAGLEDGNSNEILNPKETGIEGNAKKFEV